MGMFDGKSQSNDSKDRENKKDQENKDDIPSFPGLKVLPEGVDEGTWKPRGPLPKK